MMFMKTMNFSNPAISCGVMLALMGLTLSRPVIAQPLSASFFLPPTAENFVRITSPANHATFYAPVDIPIFAFAREEQVAPMATPIEYTNVEFYAGTKDLGPGFCLTATNPPRAFPLPTYLLRPLPCLGAMYCLVWTNAPVGSFALTAVARGHGLNLLSSVVRTSAPVNITILVATNTQNSLDKVTLLATDPVAIAATNACWIWPGMTNATPSWTNWPPKKWQSLTNWGPKNALFTVFRYGDVRSNLTVNYRIGGTASNGVDYVELPGSVAFPVGEAAALIPVVPIDNRLTTLSKTVLLSLNADTNSPPDYTVGVPARAAALILDYWPRPLPMLLSDHWFHFNTNGPDGAWFELQHSSDLLNWTSVSTNQVIHGSIDYVDPDAPDNALRFYRFAPLTKP
jgi:hypothetical protein